MLHAIEMQISLRNKEWFCVSVCVCVLYVHAAGSSKRGGAQIGQLFFFLVWGGGGDFRKQPHTYTLTAASYDKGLDRRDSTHLDV